MSTRLNTEIREKVLNKIMIHRFNDSVAKHFSARAALADMVYHDLYSRAVLKKMNDLPKGWLPSTIKIGAQFGQGGSAYAELSFNGSMYGPINTCLHTFPTTLHRLVQERHSSGCVKVYEDSHPIAVQARELKAAQNILTGAIDTARHSIKHALNATGSIKQLLAVWPEVEPFMRPYMQVQNTLPSIPTSHLNAMLDLPV